MRSSALCRALLAAFICLPALAAAPVRTTHPGSDCPAPKGSLPPGAAKAMASHLGAEAVPLCVGDLNGNGRPELLAAVIETSYGAGLGFYRITSKSAIFEAGASRVEEWRPLLVTSDRVENQRGVIGWQLPVAEDGIGLRFTMTHGKGICIQLRRLDLPYACTEEPLLLIRWDETVARYEPGACSAGTAGPAIPIVPKQP